MATPRKKQSETKVTRIKASDDAPAKKSAPKKAAQSTAKANKPVRAISVAEEPKTPRRNIFKRFWVYLKGSWYELRQVRWPDRRSTWGMTGALLAFTAFFVVIILLLDAGFAKLFNYIIGK